MYPAAVAMGEGVAAAEAEGVGEATGEGEAVGEAGTDIDGEIEGETAGVPGEVEGEIAGWPGEVVVMVGIAVVGEGVEVEDAQAVKVISENKIRITMLNNKRPSNFAFFI